MARAKAEAMIGQISDMTLAELSMFVHSDKANTFMQEFQRHKKEFLDGLQIQGTIDHIEKMALQSRHDRDSARVELEGVRASAKQAVREAKNVIADANAEAKKIRDDVHAEEIAARREMDKDRARIQRVEAESRIDREAAADQLEKAKHARKGVDEVRQFFADRRRSAQELIAVLAAN